MLGLEVESEVIFFTLGAVVGGQFCVFARTAPGMAGLSVFRASLAQITRSDHDQITISGRLEQAYI
jgi:hypothetical protein